MKNKLKSIGAVLLCAAMLWLPTSCRKPQAQAPIDSSEKTGETTTVPEWELLFASNGECNYDIVCPGNANANIVNVCQKLANSIKKYTKAIVRVVYDDVAAPGVYEILVGPTNRPESVQALRDLRYDDYSVTCAGEKIVLAGAYDSSAADAVNKFIESVLKPQEGADRVVLRASDICTVSAEYPVEELLLPGGSVGGYSIVIPAKPSISEFRTAKLFQILLADKTGYQLPIRDDTDVSDLEILIGNTARTQHTAPDVCYRIAASGNRLEFHASSLFGYQALLEDLEYVYWKIGTKQLTWNAQTDIQVGVADRLTGGSEHIIERSGDVRVMYSNILGGCDATLYPHEQRNRMLSELILEYLPDVVGLQECKAAARAGEYGIISCLTASGVYTELSPGPAVNCTPLLYRADRLELVSSGYHAYADGANDSSKGVTWAVFRIRESGKLFAAASTHFAYNKTHTEADNRARMQDARELLAVCAQIRSEHGDIGIVVGGDYNCNNSSEPYAILTDGGMRGVQKLAESTEDRKTWHSYPKFNVELGIYDQYFYPASGPYSGSIDHIMTCGGDLFFHTFDIVTDRYALLSSDHCPTITEFTIN